MVHPKAVALLLALALALATGCAGVRWWVQKAVRDPGESLADFPEVVWEQYDCGSQRRPFFIIESNELVPPRVRSGGEFNHRLVYVMCPVNPTEVIAGQLATRIRFKGAPILVDTQPGWEVKPGRWIIDATVSLPADAEPGVYAYELEFDSAPVTFEKSLTFVVREP
jgi:hypothetical protein